MIASEKEADVKRMADQLFAEGPDWVTFYREVLGPRGIVRHTFPTREMLAAFEQTEGYQEILRMLAKLREQGPTAARDGRAYPGDHRSAAEEPARVAQGRGLRAPHEHEQALHLEAPPVHRRPAGADRGVGRRRTEFIPFRPVKGMPWNCCWVHEFDCTVLRFPIAAVFGKIGK